MRKKANRKSIKFAFEKKHKIYQMYSAPLTAIDQNITLSGDLGPEVINLFSCSTQLSMKFHLVIK